MEAKPNTTRVYEALVRNESASSLYVTLSASQREAALRYGPCGVPDPLAWHMVRPASDANYPWPGTTFGVFIVAVWYWCSDQVYCTLITRTWYMYDVLVHYTHAATTEIIARHSFGCRVAWLSSSLKSTLFVCFTCTGYCATCTSGKEFDTWATWMLVDRLPKAHSSLPNHNSRYAYAQFE